jgi:hypothetical protein
MSKRKKIPVLSKPFISQSHSESQNGNIGVFCTVLVYRALYWCIMRCTGVLCSVLVYRALYWCIVRCTGVSCAVLMYRALYSCIVHCTGRVLVDVHYLKVEIFLLLSRKQ